MPEFFILIGVVGLTFFLVSLASNSQREWAEKLTNEQTRLVREQTKLLNDIKTQLLILNAKIDRNKDFHD